MFGSASKNFDISGYKKIKYTLNVKAISSGGGFAFYVKDLKGNSQQIINKSATDGAVGDYSGEYDVSAFNDLIISMGGPSSSNIHYTIEYIE